MVEVSVVFAAPEDLHTPHVGRDAQAFTSTKDSEASGTSIGATEAPPNSAAAESIQLMQMLDEWTPYAMLGAADSALFRLALHESSSSAENDSRLNLRSFRQGALRAQRFGVGSCVWLTPSTSARVRNSTSQHSDGNSGRSYHERGSRRSESSIQVEKQEEQRRRLSMDSEPLIECRWSLEEPVERVSFLRLQLGCKQCALRIAEVILRM